MSSVADTMRFQLTDKLSFSSRPVTLSCSVFGGQEFKKWLRFWGFIVKEGNSNFSCFLCRGHSGHSGVQPERGRTPEAQESLQRNHLQVFGGAGSGSASFLRETPAHRACEAALERAAHGKSLGAKAQKTCSGQ